MIESEGPTRTIIFRNSSFDAGSVCLFHHHDGSKVFPTAWLTKPSFPSTVVAFRWEVNRCFVWAERGPLAPGMRFIADGISDADPVGAGAVRFTYDGGFRFGEPADDHRPGSLTIRCDDTIPARRASIGIGMSGLPTCVTPAEPGDVARFSLRPDYRITFGEFTQGDLLAPSSIAGAAEIAFPPGISVVTAEYRADGTWLIRPLTTVDPSTGNTTPLPFLNR